LPDPLAGLRPFGTQTTIGPVRCFTGRMDELTVCEREFSDDDVRKLGVPKRSHDPWRSTGDSL